MRTKRQYEPPKREPRTVQQQRAPSPPTHRTKLRPEPTAGAHRHLPTRRMPPEAQTITRPRPLPHEFLPGLAARLRNLSILGANRMTLRPTRRRVHARLAVEARPHLLRRRVASARRSMRKAPRPIEWTSRRVRMGGLASVGQGYVRLGRLLKARGVGRPVGLGGVGGRGRDGGSLVVLGLGGGVGVGRMGRRILSRMR